MGAIATTKASDIAGNAEDVRKEQSIIHSLRSNRDLPDPPHSRLEAVGRLTWCFTTGPKLALMLSCIGSALFLHLIQRWKKLSNANIENLDEPSATTPLRSDTKDSPPKHL